MISFTWKEITAWSLVTFLAGSLVCFALLGPQAQLPAPAPADDAPAIFDPSDLRSNGWVPDPQAVEEIKAELEEPVFADTPCGRSQDPLPAEVFMWQAYQKLYNSLPPSKDQGHIGACVSFGTNNAVTRTMACDIAFGGAKFEFRDIAEEVTYGGSRVQIGGGRLGSRDGSVGVWAAQFVQKWGIVARDKYTGADLTSYNVQTCRTYGVKGVPTDLQTVAKQNPVKTITQISSWADAKRALASGYGIAVCSGQGFSTHRDANGICRPSGSWSHCMCLDGYCTIQGKECGHIENSWGPESATGPTGPGGPAGSGFWADSQVIDRMLKQKDSWAFSGIDGFLPRKIDWYVLGPNPRDPFAHARLQLRKK